MLVYHFNLNGKMKNVFGHLLALVATVCLMGRGANGLQLLLFSVLSKFCMNSVTVFCSLCHYVSLRRRVMNLEAKDDGFLLTPPVIAWI